LDLRAKKALSGKRVARRVNPPPGSSILDHLSKEKKFAEEK